MGEAQGIRFRVCRRNDRRRHRNRPTYLLRLPDKGVPNDVLRAAKYAAVIPNLVQGAFVFGGEHESRHLRALQQQRERSRSLLRFRSQSGPQIGGKSTGRMLFLVNDQGMNDWIRGHVKLGAAISAGELYKQDVSFEDIMKGKIPAATTEAILSMPSRTRKKRPQTRSLLIG